jgi:hypothetical protein
MSKYKFSRHFDWKPLLLMAISFIWHTQSSLAQNTFKFKVQKSVTRFQDVSGQWGPWAPLGDLDEKVDQHFVFDYSLKKIFWYTHAEGVEPRITEYLITEMKTDSSYKDFGVWFTTYIVQPKSQDKQVFKMMYSDREQSVSCVIITGEEVLQSKHYLLIVPGKK